MDRNSKEYKTFCDILEEELVLAQGCTEPISVAYAAARGRDILGDIPDKVIVNASGSIVKNVKSVIVPNTGQLKGIPASVAAGIIAGKTEKKLECIADATKEDAKKMQEYLDTAHIEVHALLVGASFDMVLTLIKGEHKAKIRITHSHTNIVYEEKDGEVLLNKEVAIDEDNSLTDRSVLTIRNI